MGTVAMFLCCHIEGLHFRDCESGVPRSALPQAINLSPLPLTDMSSSYHVLSPVVMTAAAAEQHTPSLDFGLKPGVCG